MWSTIIQAAANAIGKSNVTLLNPLGLTLDMWVAVLTLVVVGVSLLDPIALGICYLLQVPKMPSRVPEPIMKGLEKLQAKDYLFLVINQPVQACAMMHFVHFACLQEGVLRTSSEMTVGNTVVFVFLVFLLDDFVYYWSHRCMHLPSVYALVHKHHHRQSLPRRGYWDAANETPMEQIVGLTAVQATFYLLLACSPFGVHAAGVLLFIVMYAATAMLNHFEYDVKVPVLSANNNPKNPNNPKHANNPNNPNRYPFYWATPCVRTRCTIASLPATTGKTRCSGIRCLVPFTSTRQV
jgi:sterol desaturase/sphingolipid hydroxylase (fatty acid hydroxylase superfamily)